MSLARTTSSLIGHAERTVGPALAQEVADYLSLATDVTDAAGELIERVQQAPGDPRAIHACAFLLARLVTDLNAVAHLIRLGYVAPALSLTAGMLEMAHTCMFIGADEERAGKWLSHDDTKIAAPWRIYDIIQDVARHIDVRSDIAKREWDVIYRTACMAKHGNPLAFKQVGFVERGNERFILAGPYSSRDVSAWAHMTLGYAIRYTKLASLKFIIDHVGATQERDELYRRWRELGDRQHQLAAADVASFGASDMPDVG